MKGHSRLAISARAATSVALIAIIVVNIDWPTVIRVFSAVDLTIFALTVVFNGIGVITSSLKWRWFLMTHNMDHPLVRLHALYYVGFFFNNFLPSMVGGDVVRALNTAKGGRYAESISCVLSERAIGFGVMIALAGIAALWNLHRGIPVGLTWLASAVAVSAALIAVAGGFLLTLNHAAGQTRPHHRWLDPVMRFVGVLRETLTHPRTLIKAVLASVVFHILLVTNGYLFARSVGINLDILVLAVVFPVALLVAMLPISLNGLGVKEGALIILLGQMGVTSEQALVIALLARAFIIFASIVGGVLFAVNRELFSLQLPSRSVA